MNATSKSVFHRPKLAAVMLIAALLVQLSRPVAAQPTATPPAQPTVRVEAARHSDLVRAEKFVQAGQWDEAVEILRRVQQEEGERLFPLPESEAFPGCVRYTTLNAVCQMRLAELHWTAPEALDLYRRRVDPLARRWYDEGVRDRNEALLHRIVDELFASSFADNALLRLGELALERGEFDSARQYWERISPLLRVPSRPPDFLATGEISWWHAIRKLNVDERWEDLQLLMTTLTGGPNWLAYPDTELELADVRARLVLASILEGSAQRAATELEILRRLHEDAEGYLAGKSGNYAQILSELLRESENWLPPAGRPGWFTLGGTQSRDGKASAAVDPAGRPLWQIDLPKQTAENEMIGFGRQRVAEDMEDGLLSYHPVVVTNLDDEAVVFWNESNYIKAVKLHAHPAQPPWHETFIGDEAFAISSVSPPGRVLHDRTRRPYVGVPRYTATVHGHKLFARMGSPLTSSREESDPDRLGQPRSLLMGLDLSKQGKVLPGFPIEPDGVRWEFEGTPVTDGSNLYVAMRLSGAGSGRAECHVACFELPTVQPAEKLRPKWRVRICDGSTLNAAVRDYPVDEITHNLLSLHEGTIYCNTNLGAAAAVRARDGAVQWITEYERAAFQPVDPDVTDLHYFRDLNPCVVHQGIVLVAPQDTPNIFALDALTGRCLWEAKAADVVHLLGVGAEHLIAGGDSLYWIDLYGGAIHSQFPLPGYVPRPDLARPEPRGYGRGVLAGGQVYFPTRDRIFVFAQEPVKSQIHQDRHLWEPRTERVVELPPRGAAGGNLIIADGVLLIAGPDKLYAFDEYGPQKAAEE